MFKIFVRGVVFNSKKEILLVEKLANQKTAAGKILLPGGSVEFGENPEGAIKREILEETNININSSKIIDTQTMVLNGVHWLGIYYLCTSDNFDASNMETEKHSRVFWGNTEDVKNDKQSKNILKKL